MNEQEKLNQWQLEESSAESYERYLIPLFFAPGAQYLIELAALREGERVLDLAAEQALWRVEQPAKWALMEWSSASIETKPCLQ